MALTAADSGAVLIAGAAPAQGGRMQTKIVRVVRAFYFDRKLIPVGEIVTLPMVFALEVMASNKAESVPEVSEALAEPVPVETPKPKGGAKHAK